MNTFKGKLLWLITIILVLFSSLPTGSGLVPTSTTTWTWDSSDHRNASLPFVVWNYAVPDGNANIGSTFQTNLNMALNNLSINGANQTLSTGFGISRYGQSPNMIYALIQCRGDASQQECSKCSEDAKAAVLGTTSCVNSTSCQVWLDMCNLRYDNSSFISQLSNTDQQPGNALWTNHSSSESNYRKIDPVVFGVALSNLLVSLSAEAARESADHINILGNYTTLVQGFAAGSTNSNSSSSSLGDGFVIDAVVQCSRDLSPSDCTKCLSNVIVGLKSPIEQTAAEAESMLLSCFITFNSSFTQTAPAPSPSDSSSTETPAPSPSDSSSTETPSPSPSPVPQNDKSSSSLKHQVPATIILLAVMIFMALLA